MTRRSRGSRGWAAETAEGKVKHRRQRQHEDTVQNRGSTRGTVQKHRQQRGTVQKQRQQRGTVQKQRQHEGHSTEAEAALATVSLRT